MQHATGFLFTRRSHTPAHPAGFGLALDRRRRGVQGSPFLPLLPQLSRAALAARCAAVRCMPLLTMAKNFINRGPGGGGAMIAPKE